MLTLHLFVKRWAATVVRCFAVLSLVAPVVLSGCPTVPNTTLYDQDAFLIDLDSIDSDADVVIPLTISGVQDNAGDPEGGERVSVYGSGFEPGAKVYFGEELAGGILVIDQGQLNCDAPAHEPGLVDVTAELLDERTATLPEAYLYRSPLALVDVVPAEGLVLGGEEVTITGEGFGAATHILIGGRLLEAQVVVDAETITGVVPSRLAAFPGSVDVIASDGFEQRTLDRAYRYVDLLRLDWLSPSAGPIGGGTYVNLYGAGFEPGTGVTVDGTAAEIVTPGAGNVLTIRVPPHVDGPTSLTIDNGYQSVVAPLAFTYIDADAAGTAAALLNAYPVRGGTSGGTQVALAVVGLTAISGVTVTFDDAPATVLEVRPEEFTIVAVIPEGEPGPATVAVTIDGVTVSRDDLFLYETSLQVDALIPASAKPAGGKTIVVQGAGFTPSTVARFGAHEATTEYVSTGELSVQLPAGSPGLVDVRFVDATRSSLLAAGFEYRTGEPADLLAVSPPVGAQAGGRLVRVHGTGFTSFDPVISFGLDEASDVEVIDDATIHLRSPRGDVGNVMLDAGDAGRLAMAYTYFDPTANYGGTGSGPIPEALNVTVLDLQTREPIEEAFVILWDDLGTPFKGLTDDRGQIVFSDVQFGPEQMVTAAKDQYTTASVVDFDARDATLFLIPLVSAPPSPGNPGPGPQPLPDGGVAGAVAGFDKYIVPPLGACDPKLSEGGEIVPGSSLCQECEVDEDCQDPGAKCTFIGDEGTRCTTACEVPSDCPDGFVCSGVAGGDVQCLPAPGKPTAWCGTTIPDVFADEESRTGGFTNGQNFFDLDSAPGEHAIVCLGGYMDPDSGVFVPMRMGVRRHVFTMPGDFIGQQDVVLDIPLTRTLKMRLDDVPTGAGQPDHFEAEVFIDLGADGVFPMPNPIACVDLDPALITVNDYFPEEPPVSCSELTDGPGLSFSLPNYPSKFEDSLYDASYSIYARAATLDTWMGAANTASFTLHKDITEVDDDTIIEVVPGGLIAASTGVALDVAAMHGPVDDVRVWAAADSGEIVMWNGFVWAIQAWLDRPVRAVWSRAADDAWAAGDLGLIAHWDGLVWTVQEVPEELAEASWRAMDGVDDQLWLVGDAGVWRLDADGWSAVEHGVGVSPTAIRDIWIAGDDDVWLVGSGGLIRRITPSGIQILDQPGDQLLSIHGLGSDDVWAVGEKGRLLHWDGMFWFDYLPKTRRDLHGVHGVAGDDVYAVGDAGVILRWDGALWIEHLAAEHIDLDAVWVAGDGRVRAGGAHSLIIGPLLRIPRAVNPSITYDHVSLQLQWDEGDGAEATFTYLQLTEGGGFPFWQLMIDGHREIVPLPDLLAAADLQAIWSGPGFMRMIRVYMPSLSIDAYDNTDLSQYVWRSWATEDYPVIWEASPAPF